MSSVECLVPVKPSLGKVWQRSEERFRAARIALRDGVSGKRRCVGRVSSAHKGVTVRGTGVVSRGIKNIRVGKDTLD